MIFFDFAGTHFLVLSVLLALSISLYFCKQVFGEGFLNNLLKLLVEIKTVIFFVFNFFLGAHVLTSISGEGTELQLS